MHIQFIEFIKINRFFTDLYLHKCSHRMSLPTDFVKLNTFLSQLNKEANKIKNLTNISKQKLNGTNLCRPDKSRFLGKVVKRLQK